MVAPLRGILATLALAGAARAGAGADTVEARHPGLASGALTFARLAELPRGVLVRCGKLEWTEADLAKVLREFEGPPGEELERNAFAILEGEATERLLVLDAKAAGGGGAGKPDRELLREHLDRITAKVQVTDAEIAAFYEENRELVGNTALDRLKEPIRRHLSEMKKGQAVREHVRTLGQRLRIEVSANWADAQAPLALDNPADKARRSGKPALVVFTGPCG